MQGRAGRNQSGVMRSSYHSTDSEGLEADGRRTPAGVSERLAATTAAIAAFATALAAAFCLLLSAALPPSASADQGAGGHRLGRRDTARYSALRHRDRARSAGRRSRRGRQARRAHRSSQGPWLIIHGAGDGHGVGMSQWGALGDAEHGWSYTQILSHYYTGTSIGHVSKKHVVKVLVHGHVRKVPIEAYVRGVVAAEMPSNWPQAALEAQAVASRTYAITDHAGGKRFDVYSDTRSQMYLGKAAETSATNAAVRATKGQIVTYEGHPAITYFFASSGGRTENVQDSFLGASPQPWLKGVPDPYDSGPLHTWKVKMRFSKAAKRLRGLVEGSFKGIEVLKRGFSPRIVSAYVLGSKGKVEVTGPELEARLGLYCAWAYFSVLRGGKLHREPDLSGTPAGSEAPSEEGTSTGPTGGQAPGAGEQAPGSGESGAGGQPPAGEGGSEGEAPITQAPPETDASGGTVAG